jgi:hypothetical protein
LLIADDGNIVSRTLRCATQSGSAKKEAVKIEILTAEG